MLGLFDEPEANGDQQERGQDLHPRKKKLEADGDVKNPHDRDDAEDEIQETRGQARQESMKKAPLDGLGDDKDVDRAERDGCDKPDHQSENDEHAYSFLSRDFAD